MQYSRERRSRFPTKIFGRLYRKANEVPINLVTMACFHIFGAFRKFRKATIRFMSVRPRGTTRLPLNDFQLIWYLSIFRKSVDQIRFIKIWQELCVLYMKTSRHLWRHRDEFFLEWEMFHTSVVWKIKTHILCSVTFSRTHSRTNSTWAKCLWGWAGYQQAKKPQIAGYWWNTGRTD